MNPGWSDTCRSAYWIWEGGLGGGVVIGVRGEPRRENRGPGGEGGSGWVCRHRNVSRSRVSAVGGRTHIGHGGGMNIFKNLFIFFCCQCWKRTWTHGLSISISNVQKDESVMRIKWICCISFFAFLNEQAVKVSRLDQSLSIDVVFLGRKLNEMQLMPKKRNLKSRQKWRSARKKNLENIELKTV